MPSLVDGNNNVSLSIANYEIFVFEMYMTLALTFSVVLGSTVSVPIDRTYNSSSSSANVWVYLVIFQNFINPSNVYLKKVTHTYTQTHSNTIYRYIYIYIYLCVCVCMCVCVLCMCVFVSIKRNMHAYKYTHIHTRNATYTRTNARTNTVNSMK